MRILKDGDQYFALIAALDGTLTKLKFGNSISSPPVIIQEGNLGGVLTTNLYGLGVAIDNSVWAIMSVNQSNGQVFKIDYPNSCFASPATSSQTNPVVSFSQAGSFKVAFSAINSGIASTKVKTLSVSSLVAPDIDFLIRIIAPAIRFCLLPPLQVPLVYSIGISATVQILLNLILQQFIHRPGLLYHH